MVKKKEFLSLTFILLSAFVLLASCGNDPKKSTKNNSESERHFKRANDYYKNKNVDKAIEEYKKAISFNKQHKMAHFNLATLYNKKGLYLEALNEYQEYLKFADQEKDSDTIEFVKSTIEELKKKTK